MNLKEFIQIFCNEAETKAISRNTGKWVWTAENDYLP
jgi:hypothetical protein